MSHTETNDVSAVNGAFLPHGEAGMRIAAALRDEILVGGYQPGERIRQQELAGRHGASRVPVREALRILEAEGLVTLVTNAGSWVSRLSAQECTEMYQMRERLEPLLQSVNRAPLEEGEHEVLLGFPAPIDRGRFGEISRRSRLFSPSICFKKIS